MMRFDTIILFSLWLRQVNGQIEPKLCQNVSENRANLCGVARLTVCQILFLVFKFYTWYFIHQKINIEIKANCVFNET